MQPHQECDGDMYTNGKYVDALIEKSMLQNNVH